MKVLITGGLGFVGSHLQARLEEEGHIVHIFDRERVEKKRYHRGDINDFFSLEHAFSRASPLDACVHLAAMVSRKECEETPALSIMTNTIGAQNIVHLCSKRHIRLLYAGSSEEYGDAYYDIAGNPVCVSEDTPFGAPTSYYAMTKRHADELIRYNALQNGLRATTMRFCMLYGPGELGNSYRSAVARFADTAIKNQPIRAHRDTERSWCYIEDVVDAIMRILDREQEQKYECYNLGRHEPISAVNLAHKVVDTFGSDSEIIETEIEPTIIPIKRMSFDRAKRVLGWEATTSLDEGLKALKGSC